MKARIIGSTKMGYQISESEAMLFSGHAAGICYMPDDIDTLFNEQAEKTNKRANGTLSSGHHSVWGHVEYNFVFEGIPKILAMVLNNEKEYNTSEKSARYTKMQPSKEEENLYNKWIEIFYDKILQTYPELKDKKIDEKTLKYKNIEKLAQENARYMISVFTPATTMEYSTSLRQMRYILKWMENFMKNGSDSAFNIKIKEVFKDFSIAMAKLGFDVLDDGKSRTISLLSTREREEEWGENYSTNYEISFAALAQAQRHRTLYYEMNVPENPKYFVPFIIRNTELEEKWLKDIASLSKRFPQGMLLNINERGTVENFVLKAKERLCGHAQIEIAVQTDETMKQYLKNVENSNEMVYKYLLPYSKGARCTFPGWKCTTPCVFGPKNAMKRKI